MKTRLKTIATIIAVVIVPLCWQKITIAEEKAEEKTKVSQIGLAAESEVRQVVALHLKGVRTGDIELLKRAWDVPNAHVKQVSNGKIDSQPIEKTFDVWAKQRDAKMTGEILSVDIAGDRMAVVKVDLNWHGGQFTDFLTLLKSESGWRIVEKTYIGSTSRYGFFYGSN